MSNMGLNALVSDFVETSGVPGVVAGVYHAGQQEVVACGVTNVVTGESMREDTGFLLGSVTKVLTTTLVMQQVEQGRIDLDERVVTYLPEFRLEVAGAADIRIRHLLNHTNGIDADLYFPDADGPDALRIAVDGMAEQVGTLFAPGEHISYSNGGMIVAGRVLEVVTGVPYHELLQRNLFDPAGMTGAVTSPAQAILRSTAVGHFPSQDGARRTDLFKLPDTWGPAGSSAIAGIADLLAFGRIHLDGGLAPSGARVLSEESVRRMRTVTYSTGSPHIPPIGLGWLLMPFGDVEVLSHSGASPGGVAVLVAVPGRDLVFAAYGNDARAMALFDRILLTLLRNRLGVTVPDLITATIEAEDLGRYEGTYRSNQLRIAVRAVDGGLEETTTYEPADEQQSGIFTAFVGGSIPVMTRRYLPVGKDVFAPAGLPLEMFTGYSRQLLVSYHDFRDGVPRYRSAGGRMTRRAVD
ncbi:class A beta-lactamase-related serine hydrolase [Nocardia yunnanensis]|uniref:Class A beta-lactamase-related serine hydrolase n=1 Tax=Nocardia yunnanensis TaxID=2382165 RepID=A0A386ZG92_9NOCA|nr:serine hydrolase domain-containing protein [Nocardia yunnanensis]AYF76253.1 class A beta-lactamase-related serine hydrolase [Nocardia yunnanensis]